MHIIENTLSAACVPLAAMVGGKSACFVAEITNHELPAWFAPLVGPVGALAGTIIAIRWLLTRLDKAETKAESREAERDKNLSLIAAMTVQNQTIIQQNSEVLTDVKNAIEKRQ